jgi:hypothetical protein
MQRNNEIISKHLFEVKIKAFLLLFSERRGSEHACVSATFERYGVAAAVITIPWVEPISWLFA